MKIIAASASTVWPAGQNTSKTLVVDNTEDPRTLVLDGVDRIDLNFPKFTDGRAFSQAFLLRRRMGFAGEIWATGDVLIDQLLQMQRSGFDVAVLREDQNPEFAQAQLQRYAAFYQGDALAVLPAFARADGAAPSEVSQSDKATGAASTAALPAAQSSAPSSSRFAPEAQAAGSAMTRNAEPSADYVIKLAETQGVLAQAAAQYAGADGSPACGTSRVTQASSLGAEDVVISHLINSLKLDIGIFVLETGRLHAETLALLQRTRASSRAPVRVYQPVHEAVVQFGHREGPGAMYTSVALRKACCGLRKMEPLARALEGKDAWITGLRREQSGARADVPLVDTSEPRTKINPLANWTWGDVWHYIQTHQVDYNPLHDQFFPSIGCEPCTRAISLGEDFRSGRWWWEDENAKECGLHVKTTDSHEEAKA